MNKQTIMNLRDWASLHIPAVASACVFATVLGIYLLTQHTVHVVGALPYALILLCPLMHFLMPGMHGGHEGHGNQGDQWDHAGHSVQGSEVGHDSRDGRDSRAGQEGVAQHRQERD